VCVFQLKNQANTVPQLSWSREARKDDKGILTLTGPELKLTDF
jgi:hypothetical protein